MKFLVVSLLALVSSTASVSLADGFRCVGQGYRVQVYNQVQPSHGTKNPAVLVVSSTEPEVGTIAVLRGSEIEKSISDRALTYEGVANATATGRFVSVRLDVAKQPNLEGKHFGLLRLNADGELDTAKLVCVRYLKGQQ